MGKLLHWVLLVFKWFPLLQKVLWLVVPLFAKKKLPFGNVV